MSLLDAVFEPDLFTIRRFTYGEKDALGRKARTLAAETPSDGLLEQIDSGYGTHEGETFVVTKYRATMPAGTDVRVDDEVESRGLRYTVTGSPAAVSVPGYPSVGIVTAVLQYVGPVRSA
jgi:hypothetical protein